RGLGAFGAEVTIRYCAKTNNEAGVLRILAACGSHVLTSHPAEVELGLRCGFPPGRVAYQQPVLLEAEVRAVLQAGVAWLHVYRLDDIPILAKAASELGRKVRLSLRLRDSSVGPLGFGTRRLRLTEAEVGGAAEPIRRPEC